MNILKIRIIGDEVLRQVASEVDEFDENLVRLGEEMLEVMHDSDGIGLAAPQVSENLRLFVYWVPGDDDHPDIAPQFLANPVGFLLIINSQILLRKSCGIHYYPFYLIA